MINQKEIRELIAEARKRGAIIRTRTEGPYDDEHNGIIVGIQVRSGIPKCGPGWMPLIAGSECLCKFLYAEPVTQATPCNATNEINKELLAACEHALERLTDELPEDCLLDVKCELGIAIAKATG